VELEPTESDQGSGPGADLIGKEFNGGGARWRVTFVYTDPRSGVRAAGVRRVSKRGRLVGAAEWAYTSKIRETLAAGDPVDVSVWCYRLCVVFDVDSRGRESREGTPTAALAWLAA
jgi:hypothetical protein